MQVHFKKDLASADGVLRVVIGAREKEEADLVRIMITVEIVFANYWIPDCSIFLESKALIKVANQVENPLEIIIW